MRRVFNPPDPTVSMDRWPVSLVKDQASVMWGHWTSSWADSGAEVKIEFVADHDDFSGPDAEGTALTPGPEATGTALPYDDTHPIYDVEAVIVPVEGDWLVRDGEVTQIVETDLKDTNSSYWTYEVIIDAPLDEGWD